MVDPVRSHKGFFAWKQGRVCPLSGYYVFGNIGEKIELEPGVQPAQPKKKRRKWLFWLMLGLSLLAAGVVAATLLLNRPEKGHSPGARPELWSCQKNRNLSHKRAPILWVLFYRLFFAGLCGPLYLRRLLGFLCQLGVL